MNSSLTGNIEIDALKDGFGELKENFQHLGANMTLGSLNDTKAIELINKIDGIINKTYEVTESVEIENNDENKNDTVGIIDNGDYYEGKISQKTIKGFECNLNIDRIFTLTYLAPSLYWLKIPVNVRTLSGVIDAASNSFYRT